ncbi:MAG: DUF3084 domain-containing protein [Thermosynechococcaceae cyanobacterium]
MTGYILILAIIVLGGALATLGDRLGSRVGKARLSLFNLRPKNTAVVVTILTGSLISASTLGILLATSKELRDAVLNIEQILRRSREVQKQLDQALVQKEQTQQELSKSRAELIEAVRRLRRINESLKMAVARQKVSEANLNKLKGRYELAQKTLRQFGTQAKTLRSQIGQLSVQKRRLALEQQRLIVQRDQIQARLKAADTQKRDLEAAAEQARQRIQNVERQKQQLETAIAQAQQNLQAAVQQQSKLQQSVAQVQSQLAKASTEQAALRQERIQLEQEIAALEENRKRLTENLRVLLLGLRRGNVTIRAGQVLATGVVQNLNTREQALQALNTLLQQARRNAIVLTNPQNLSPTQQVVQMTKADVDGLLQQLGDGKAYVVRILSALNYLEGENQVIVVPQTALNAQVFESQAVVSTLTLNPATLTDEQILARINSLFATANRRAIEAGVLPDPVTGTVGSFRQIELFRFVLALKERNDNTPIEIQAVTATKVFSSGPLTLTLQALRNGQVILHS